MAMLVAALAAMRRRFRRVAVTLAVLATVPVRSWADDIQVGAYDSTPATTGMGFQLEAADVGHEGDWAARGVLSYAANPMVVGVSVGGDAVTELRPISRRTMVEVGGAYAFLGRFEAGIRMPFYTQSGDSGAGDAMFRITPARGTALGDLTLHAKTRLARVDSLTVGAVLHLTLPTSTKDQFTGNDLPTVRLLGLATLVPIRRLTMSFNGGAVLRKTADYRRDIFIRQGSGLSWGTGASLLLMDDLFATSEVFGELTPKASEMTGSLSPVEVLLGATYRIDRRFVVGVAVGRGISSGLGAPELRGTFTVSVMSGARGAMSSIESRPVVAQAADSDGDGIADDKDRCPDEPEDKNGIQDEDGCPDLDSDHDGVPDYRDRCATQVEDKDGFEDDDGCPDLDNDGDGVADAQDKCPDQPESFNGVDDDDGCPDTGGGTATTVQTNPNRSPAKAAAEAKFLRGRDLMQQKQYRDACAAFEHSLRLDPASGTRYNLAGCYVEIGKLATAWKVYRELAETDKNAVRRARSDELAAQLAARVPKLRLNLQGAPAGANVFMNGSNVNAVLGIETPVEIGTYTIVAEVPSHRGWRKIVEVKKEGEVVVIDIDPGPAR